MTELATGPSSKHVNQSFGGDAQLMKFYHTRAAETQAQVWGGFKPDTVFRHKGTGYASNHRPQIYYTKTLDNLDNPFMGNLCQDNYSSITTKSYQDLRLPTGKETYPIDLFYAPTGFIREKMVTNPLSNTVQDVHFDTRLKNAPNNFLAPHKPYLHHLNPKDATELQNSGYGPAYMESEYKSKIIGNMVPPRTDEDLYHRTVGKHLPSGHTANNPIYDPIIDRPFFVYDNKLPGFITSRPMGASIYTKDYKTFQYPKGSQNVPKITTNSERNTGSTRENMDVHPPYSNNKGPLSADTTYNDKYHGYQWPLESHSDKLNKTTMGNITPMGHSRNSQPYLEKTDQIKVVRIPPDDLIKKQKFFEKGSATPWHDGYTKSLRIHLEPMKESQQATIRNLEPYQARSRVSRDTFIHDTTHEHKMHTALI